MRGVLAEPTYEQVAALPAYDVPALGRADMDGNGHLSVHDHVRIAAAGAHVVLLGAGMNPERRAADGTTVFTAEHHVWYLHELRDGVGARVHTRVVDLGERAIHLVGYLVDPGSARVATVLEALVLSASLTSRRTAPFPVDVRERLARVRDQHAALPWTPRLSGAIEVRR